MPQPTHHDANLILHLYEMRREEKLRSARAWFFANFKVKSMADFNLLCPPGSQDSSAMDQSTTATERDTSLS